MVTFKSKASRDVDYHTNVGMQLLKMMGRDTKLPSAMFADDVPDALSRLQQAVAELDDDEVARENKTGTEKKQSDDEDKPERVSLKQRAEPLLKLLQKASEANVGLMWE
ncbi:MAG: hypothetical protein CML20_19205 [Rheinheimera sp.]|uniref:DUF1840 domain-containing protein n=1 Tax=Arsukibacterium sp. UBA3155 TaxID=1946058 RepID=UPI000C8E6B19|nr:DUF1840 domain-containing protein [Arsukibacterium sp. UBA3155]MAD76882.1 hypothetical protein [Rheinheimera sp.]|tara:strand:- start:64857 stop:65183 length:327 start_codon:yes stop_codon:yes gene_type:complete